MSNSRSLKQHLLDVVKLANHEQREFLIIGGLCATLYGVERLTRDIDFLIAPEDSLLWRLMVKKLGYEFTHGTQAFQQFEDPTKERPPLDLMLVNESTWEKLVNIARKVNIDENTAAFLPDPLHYIAMKLQAFTDPLRRSDNSDWSDILNMAKHFDIQFATGQSREIVLRYSNEETLRLLESDLEKMN